MPTFKVNMNEGVKDVMRVLRRAQRKNESGWELFESMEHARIRLEWLCQYFGDELRRAEDVAKVLSED